MSEISLPSKFDGFVEELSEQTNLSPSRTKVLALIKMKRSKQEIADLLNITEGTVQNHIQDLRSEIDAAEELIDISGSTHYSSASLFEEFGGDLCTFRSGIEYEKNKDTTIEKKIYGSPYGSCLLIEREVSKNQGSLVENRKRTEFYNGNDIPPYLLRSEKFDSYKIAFLHTAFIANAGIDPKYDPIQLTAETISEDASNQPTQSVSSIVSELNKWITLSDL